MAVEKLPASALMKVLSYRNLVHAVAGATGSTVAITAFYPLDVARMRLQVDDHRKSKYSAFVVKDILDEEGIEGLYRGWFPVVQSICCSNFVYFYCFNGLKVLAYNADNKPYPAKDLLLGFIAGVANVVITTPLWVANTRLKLQGVKLKTHDNGHARIEHEHTNYTGIIDAMSQILRKDGLLGLWSGTLPSLVLASNPAVQFMVYEALKRYSQRIFHTQELSAFTYFLMGALAKMAATFVTYPIQVVQSKLRAGQGRDGMLACIRQIIRIHGFFGLYKGLEAKLTQTVAMAALMFVTYEKIVSVVFRLMHAQMAVSKMAAA